MIPTDSKGLKRILFYYDFEPLEFWVSLFSCLWGFWLLNPYFDSFQVSTSFLAMGTLAPEWVWGFAIFLLGLLQIYVLISKYNLDRKRLAFLSMLIWCFISVGFFISNIQALACVIHPMVAFANGLVYIRLSTRNRFI